MHRFSMDQQITPNYNKSDPPQRLKSLTEKLERQEKSLTQQKWELLTNPNRLGLQKKPKQVKDKRGCLGTEAGGWLGDVSDFQEVKSVGRSRESPTCLSYLFLCYWRSGHGNS